MRDTTGTTAEVTPITGSMAKFGFQCLHLHCEHPEDARFWGHDMAVFNGDVSKPVCKACAAVMIAGCARCASLEAVRDAG